MNIEGLFGETLDNWLFEASLSPKEVVTKIENQLGPKYRYSEATVDQYRTGAKIPPATFFAHLTICFGLSREEVEDWVKDLGIIYVYSQRNTLSRHKAKDMKAQYIREFLDEYERELKKCEYNKS